MWLGERRGHVIDWATQQWVRATGRRVDLATHPWLVGPVGLTTGIGPDFIDRWAARSGWTVERPEAAGLLPSFAALAGGGFDPRAVHPSVAAFYERTSEHELDLWCDWSGVFKPFGFLVAAVFSRRLGQLNLPLSPLDAAGGMTSEVVRVCDSVTGEVRHTAWVRGLVRTGRTAYVGVYSAATVPGAPGPCVKTVFPLPNGNAVVILRPENRPDGSLLLVSEGRRFGGPGFYFTAHRPGGCVTARFLRTFRERIHVYPAEAGSVRADHTMSLWGLRCLQLHYRAQRRARVD